MINFLLHKSKWGLELCEDSKTSLIFEQLALLPSQILWEILLQSANIPYKTVGKLKKIEFWPHWDATDTSNAKYVEPDVLLVFEKIDVIIEAKIGLGNLQYEDQWKNEFIAYTNEFSNSEDRPFILIAVDGNLSFEPVKTKDYEVYRTSWDKLYNSFESLLSEIEFINPVQASLISNCFELIGIFGYKELSELLLKNCELTIEAVDNIRNLNKQI